MTYGCITVKCPRCDSVIEIASAVMPAEIFNCPVCMEGEIHLKSKEPVLQPVAVYQRKNQRTEQYVATISNIWPN